MEIIINTPGLFIHVQEAVVLIQYCIDGIINIASQFKIQLVYFIIFFLLGCIWGSFANVCIYRIPISKSIVFARSFCPNCKKTIKWFNNIPLISYLLLKAKCRDCKNKISFEYFVVELTSAISFTIVYYFYGISITSLLLLILIIFFIIIFFIDLHHYIIPNEFTYPLMIIGFVKSFDPKINSFLFRQ